MSVSLVVGSTGILEAQPSEVPPLPFSYMNALKGVSMADRLISCAKTYTNEETHRYDRTREICVRFRHGVRITMRKNSSSQQQAPSPEELRERGRESDLFLVLGVPAFRA